MSALPPEVISELLTRLPVDSILRMRCVSKRWCGLIDSSDFVKTHVAHSLTKQRRLVFGGMGALHLLTDFDDGNEVKLLQMSPDFEKPCFTWLRGSCNGLLLLERDDDIWLLNPSTRESVKLPDCRVKLFDSVEDSDNDFGNERENYGLGYDLINDDYKVVKIVEFCDEVGEFVGSRARVYSLKLNRWGSVRNFPYSLPECRPLWGANVGGALHTNVLGDSVVGFDLSREDCFSVAFPEGFDNKFGSLHVMVFEGCLCFLGGYIHHRTDVWVMKDYGVKESWTKLFSIAPPTVNPYMSIVPLVYSGDRGEVLLNYDNKKLIWYDLKRNTVRDVLVQNLPKSFYADVLVESLVRVRGFDAMNKQGGQVKAKGKKHNKKSGGFLSTGFKLKL